MSKKDLALAEKIFNGLPKLFHPKFKAGIYAYEYCFFINKSATYSPWTNDNLIILDTDKIAQEVYNNKYLDVSNGTVIGFNNDLAIFPDSFKKKLLKSFLHKVKEQFSRKRPVIIACDLPKEKYKKIVMRSFEELLMNIDMMTVE